MTEDRGWVAAPAEDLCLAFADTRYWRGSERPSDDLAGSDDLLEWVQTHGGLDARTMRRLRDRCSGDAAVAAGLFAGATGLRETLFAIFSAVASGQAVPAADWGIFAETLRRAPCRDCLRQRAPGYVWALGGADPCDADPGDADPGLETMLAGVLWSAADLLAGPRLARVRLCANERCRWVFLDDSKSGNRRWCSMSACGNRAKAHRHYLRAKA